MYHFTCIVSHVEAVRCGAKVSMLWPNTGECYDNVFSKYSVKKIDNGCAEMTLFGIKNDTYHSGFKVLLSMHTNSKLDPDYCLKTYIEHTESVKPKSNAVFITLNEPFKKLGTQGIANVLNESVDVAGLSGKGYSAKVFRCTCETTAIDTGADPEIVQN